jgi:hypothetical protein
MTSTVIINLLDLIVATNSARTVCTEEAAIEQKQVK